MYLRDKINIALQIYDQCGSLTETVSVLGYPMRRALYTWIGNEEGKKVPPKKKSWSTSILHNSTKFSH